MASGPGSTHPSKEQFLAILDWNQRRIAAHLRDMNHVSLKMLLERVRRIESQIAEAEFNARAD